MEKVAGLMQPLVAAKNVPVHLSLWCPLLPAVMFACFPWLWYSPGFSVRQISFWRIETEVLIGMSKV